MGEIQNLWEFTTANCVFHSHGRSGSDEVLSLILTKKKKKKAAHVASNFNSNFSEHSKKWKVLYLFIYKYDLRVCGAGELVHILCSWTLSIVSSLSTILAKHNVSEIGFYLRLQVKPTQLGPIDRQSWVYKAGDAD
jgi:hypothetical protein